MNLKYQIKDTNFEYKYIYAQSAVQNTFDIY